MKKIIKLLLSIAIVPICIMLLFRVCYIILYVSADTIAEYRHSIPILLYNSLRFDFQVTAYMLILPTLLSFAALYKPIRKTAVLVCRIYITIISVLLTLLGIIDLGFYLNFNSHINITLFDFFNENPESLIVTFWQDYPLLWILSGIVTIAALVWVYSKKIFKTESLIFCGDGIPLLICYLTFLVIAMRGSLRSFPLQIEDTVISDNRVFNDIIPNAPYMLKKAFKDKSKIFDAKSTDELLIEYGFNDLNEAIATLGEYSLTTDTLNSIRQVLFAKVADTLSVQQPNIVILMCESWSNYLLNLATENDEIIYGLRKHMKEDIVFQHYQSVSNATIGSIENLTVVSPFARLFASKYRYTKLPTAITIPFTGSGYDCSFMTGMDIAWENVNEALPNQGFKEVIGKYELQKLHPEYQANTIGIYDHYLLNSLLEKLNNKSSKPQMVLVMTTTNHPPFDLPDNINLSELPDSFYDNKCFENVGKDVLRKYINAYRYFNKSLAGFLDSFKQSENAKSTILIITGDHNVRSILNYNTIGYQWQNSVPLYIYLPPYLRKEGYPYDTNKYGCHYDLLPTIAPFAFKNVEYIKMGNDLLSKNVTISNSYSYNECQILAEKEYKVEAERIIRARNLLLKLYIQKVLGMNK